MARMPHLRACSHLSDCSTFCLTAPPSPSLGCFPEQLRAPASPSPPPAVTSWGLLGSVPPGPALCLPHPFLTSLFQVWQVCSLCGPSPQGSLNTEPVWSNGQVKVLTPSSTHSSVLFYILALSTKLFLKIVDCSKISKA